MPAKGRARFIFRAVESHTDAGCGTWRPFPVKRIRTGQSNTRTGLFWIDHRTSHTLIDWTLTQRSRSPNKHSVPKNVPDCNPHLLDCIYMLTPDKWESARFTDFFLASSCFCSQAESTPAHLPLTLSVSAPSEVWCFLQGERPCRTRPNQPFVPSVAVMKEGAKSG